MGRKRIRYGAYVRRRGPCPAVWVTLITMALLMVFVFFARPAIETLSVDMSATPVPEVYETREVSFDGFSVWLAVLADLDNDEQARIEAARYVSRGAAGYVLRDNDAYAVAGNLYGSREEADKITASLQEQEGIESARVLPLSAQTVHLRVTATASQFAALMDAQEMCAALSSRLSRLSASLDRQERESPAVRAELSILSDGARAAGQRLEQAAADSSNPAVRGLILLTSEACRTCDALSRETQDTALSFSGKIKYAALDMALGYIRFLQGLTS